LSEEHENHQVGFLYAMPFGETVEIRSDKPIDFLNEDEVEGAIYTIHWNGKYPVSAPWQTRDKIQATAMAIGIQWAAKEMLFKMQGRKDE